MELARAKLPGTARYGCKRLSTARAAGAAGRAAPPLVVRAVQSPPGPNIAKVVANTAAAAIEVSKAVRMKGIDAPDVEKTFVSMDADRMGAVDDQGLPLVYNRDLIQKYWETQGGALQQRWNEFIGLSVPFLTRVAALSITGGAEELEKNSASLAKDARIIMEKLGPTYIKAGQMMSVRPDILPQVALDELKVLQDSVKPFETRIAIAQIEAELGVPLGEVFDEISEDPVAAASLAQVYRARLKGTDEYVAVKVQRPAILELVSKDLYVLRRAAEVYQGIIERFAPQQRTNYVALLNEWAVGFYTELDFKNEAKSQSRMKGLLQEQGVEGVYVPRVYEELTTRRILVTEWVDGIKLSDCEPEEIRELIAVGQEAFLVQLLQVGFFHSDPHPGNIIRMNDQSKGRICLIDFGLMATIQQEEMDTMISAVIHLANKDYRSLVDDFIKLEILPADCDRAKVEPLMDKALTPYVKGGGAKKYEEELKQMYGFEENRVGGFQAMTQDMLTVMNDIPFSIPPYFALLARAVVTLEGVALTGNPDYGLVMEAYPFVARKLLSDDRPELQQALQEVLYTSGGGAGAGGAMEGTRLAVLMNSALGVVARQSGSAFVDFDTLPSEEESVSAGQALKYLFGSKSESLRGLLTGEAVAAADVLLRQAVRKGSARVFNSFPQPPFPFLPKPEDVPVPFLLPTAAGDPVPALVTPAALVEAAAPPLSREEELYAISMSDLVGSVLGEDAKVVVGGDLVTNPEAGVRLLLTALSTGGVPGLGAEIQGLAEQLLAQVGGGGGAGAGQRAEGSGTADLGAALDELSEAERAVAQEWLDSVLDQLMGRINARLEPLA